MASSEQAADLRGPYGGELAKNSASEIAVVSVTSSTQVLDLSTSTYFNGFHYVAHFVRLISDVDAYYFWTNNASAQLDETATGSTNRDRQCDRMIANAERQEVPAGRYLAIKGSTGKLRISIVNQSDLPRP